MRLVYNDIPRHLNISSRRQGVGGTPIPFKKEQDFFIYFIYNSYHCSKIESFAKTRETNCESLSVIKHNTPNAQRKIWTKKCSRA